MSAVRTVRLGGSPVRVVQVVGGAPGTSLDFEWDGTKLGVRIGDSGPFTYVDLKGDTGKGLEFTWSGTQLGVRVEGDASYTYVDLQGEPGDVGPAGAQVGGSAPTDTSVLWIDTSDGGDTGGGGASAFEYWGQGRPDVAGSLDAGGTAWVTAATQGAVFHSTTGDQGAQVWTKTAAGWIVTVGDTGWRDLATYLNAGIVTGGVLLWRRVNGWMTLHGTVVTSAAGNIVDSVLPQQCWSIRPGTSSAYAGDMAPAWRGPGTLQAWITWNNNGVSLNTGATLVSGSQFELHYAALQAWPTTLPGSPA